MRRLRVCPWEMRRLCAIIYNYTVKAVWFLSNDWPHYRLQILLNRELLLINQELKPECLILSKIRSTDNRRLRRRDQNDKKRMCHPYQELQGGYQLRNRDVYAGPCECFA